MAMSKVRGMVCPYTRAPRSCSAASARIGVEVAQLYPQISLGASAGFTGPVSGIGSGDAFRLNLGPLISQKQRDKVLSYYQQAVNDGATIVTGGGIPDMPDALKNGSWIQPTIWTGLNDDSAVINEEIFGPCCHIQPFDSEEEAIEQANRLPYGLASAIWTENLSRAARVAGQVEAGIVWVNSWFLRDLRTAFGGSKQSGIGREGGEHSLEFYTELKNICLKL